MEKPAVISSKTPTGHRHRSLLEFQTVECNENFSQTKQKLHKIEQNTKIQSFRKVGSMVAR